MSQGLQELITQKRHWNSWTKSEKEEKSGSCKEGTESVLKERVSQHLSSFLIHPREEEHHSKACLVKHHGL